MIRKLLVAFAALTIFGCNGAPVTPGAPTAMSFPFEVGKTWEYKLTGHMAEVENPIEGTATLTLTEKTAERAKFKMKMSMPPMPAQEIEMGGDLAGNPYSMGERQGAAATETVTVPAGTFTVTKEVSAEKVDGEATTSELWYNETNGLVKLVQTMTDAEGKTNKFTLELK